MPSKEQRDDNAASPAQAQGNIFKGVHEQLAGEASPPAKPRRERARKPAARFPLKLTPEQRQMLIDYARIRKKLRDRLADSGSGTQVLEFSLKELEHLHDRIEQAALTSTGPAQKQLAAILRHVIELLPEDDVSLPGDETSKVTKTAPPTGEVLYQFRITLRDIQPPIWRRIRVPECTLEDLHDYIQIAFRWSGYHLHQFQIEGERYGPVFPDDFGFEMDMRDEAKVSLSRLIPRSGRKLRWVYEYDFGDSWHHDIRFEGFLEAGPKSKSPQCVAGERSGPPEDCGGPWGYGDFLDAIADPGHENHDHLMEWCGPFDPEAFDAKQVTAEMKKLKRGRPRR